MRDLNFRFCPICGGELDTGKAKFPPSRQIFATGRYYSDKIKEELDGHPVKNFFRVRDKEFIIERFGTGNPAGYCKKCNRIFAEFEVENLIKKQED